MITAKEARALDKRETAVTDLEALDSMIRDAAERGQESIRVPHAMTRRVIHSQSFKREVVREVLIAAGYTVTKRREDGQFVDVWLEISWGANDG